MAIEFVSDRSVDSALSIENKMCLCRNKGTNDMCLAIYLRGSINTIVFIHPDNGYTFTVHPDWFHKHFEIVTDNFKITY